MSSRKIKKPGKLIANPKNATEEKNFDLVDSISFYVHCLTIFLFLIAICAAIYYIYEYSRRYLLSRNVEVSISYVRPPKPTVGETLTIRIRFKEKGGNKLFHSSSKIFREFEKHIIIVPESETLKRPVAVLTETNKSSSYISGKFSVRKSGVYEINVRYVLFLSYFVCLTPAAPLTLQVLPGPTSPKFIDFETHNPQILCLTAGTQFNYKILAEDQYGNRCQAQDVDLQKFDFLLYYMCNVVPVEHEFFYHKSNSSESRSTDENTEMARTTDTCSVDDICLKITINQPGIYNCVLKYDNYEVRNSHGSQKVLVCLSSCEETELRSTFSQVNLPGTLMYSSECRIWAVGDEDGFQDFYAGITAKSVVFAAHKIPLLLYPDMSFPINAKTKVTYYGTETLSSRDEKVTFLVQDGIRQSVRVEMDTSSGRMFIVTFAHNQGLLLKNLKLSFQEKKENLKSQISSYFTGFWFMSEKVLEIQPGNIIISSLKQVPQHPDDWLLPFNIKYEGSGLPPELMKPTTGLASQQEWINRLCEVFFNVHNENSMFQKLPDSKLLHPVSSTVSNQPLECYRLAGQILAKAIAETLLRGICTQLTHVRFTRSFLSFILGFPIVFKFLEADDPKYFRTILPVLEMDAYSQAYSFTTLPSGASDTNVVNLIPDGSNIPVTNANKEHYLNLLTNHRLIHRVEQEMTAFRNGFYHVLNRDKLSDFSESDLQKLISGGCTFSISDLKKNYRVVKEVDNGFVQAIRNQSIDTKKLLNWFWVAAENLSEEEQSYFVFFTTGNFSLPSCGLADLNPRFTISLTGTFNEPPTGHPISNEIVLGCHACFDSFERSLIQAIIPESERILLPTTDEVFGKLSCRGVTCAEDEDFDVMEEDANANEEDTKGTDDEEGAGIAGSIINWLRG